MITRGKTSIFKPNLRYILLTVKVIPEELKTVASTQKHQGWNVAMGEEIVICHEIQT